MKSSTQTQRNMIASLVLSFAFIGGYVMTHQSKADRTSSLAKSDAPTSRLTLIRTGLRR